jgi:transposase-like protein
MMQRSPSEQVGHLKKIKVKNQSEVLTPKQKNKRLREEVDILKKAVVYFAKELK